MTFNETKSLLEQIKRQRYYAQKKQEDLAELILMHQNLTYKPKTVSVQSSTINRPVENAVIKIEEAQEAYARAWDKLFKQIEGVKLLLYQLPNDERNIVEDFYLRGKSAIYIAVKYCYNRTHIYDIVNRGIKKLSKIL